MKLLALTLALILTLTSLTMATRSRQQYQQQASAPPAWGVEPEIPTAQVAPEPIASDKVAVNPDLLAKHLAKEKAEIERERLKDERDKAAKELAEKKRMTDALIQHDKFLKDQQAEIALKEARARELAFQQDQKLIAERAEAVWAMTNPDPAARRERNRAEKLREAQVEKELETDRAIQLNRAKIRDQTESADAAARREIMLEDLNRRQKMENAKLAATVLGAVSVGLYAYASCL